MPVTPIALLLPDSRAQMVRARILIGSVALACAAIQASAQPILWSSASGGNDNYFEVVVTSSNITWNEASSLASLRTHFGHSGRLASSSTFAIDLFIRDLAAATPLAFTDNQSIGFSGPWIGGLQLPGGVEPADRWTWINGDPWTYTRWLSGEPNDNSGIGEDRIQLYQRELGPINSSTIGWNDLSGQNSVFPVRSYVVEYVVPSPTFAAIFGITGLMAARRRR